MKVISGGQTGIDRTGLEVARDLGIETGGTAPLNYRTEDGHDNSLKDFGLTEDANYSYIPRTIKNVIDSDGTVLFGNMESTGSKQTINFLKQYKKPYICNPTDEQLFEFLKQHKLKVINIAGNRRSRLTAVQLMGYRAELIGGLDLYKTWTEYQIKS